MDGEGNIIRDFPFDSTDDDILKSGEVSGKLVLSQVVTAELMGNGDPNYVETFQDLFFLLSTYNSNFSVLF